MICLPYPHHNIVNSPHLTTGAPSPLLAFIQMTLGGGQLALGDLPRPLHPFPLRLRFPFMQNTAKMKGIWGVQIVLVADEAPLVSGPVLTMLWGYEVTRQVIVTVILGSCHPIISCCDHDPWWPIMSPDFCQFTHHRRISRNCGKFFVFPSF